MIELSAHRESTCEEAAGNSHLRAVRHTGFRDEIGRRGRRHGALFREMFLKAKRKYRENGKFIGHQ